MTRIHHAVRRARQNRLLEPGTRTQTRKAARPPAPAGFTWVQGRLLETEEHFQEQLRIVATLSGALYFHDHDSRRNAAGLPDTIAVVGGRTPDEPATLLLVELKREDKRPSPKQREWLTRLGRVNRVVVAWKRPSDFRELKRLFGAE